MEFTQEMETGLSLFKLPPVVDYDKVTKRYAGDSVDLSSFNEQQQIAFDSMMNFVNQSGGGMFRFLGVAGSGKTYVISRFIEWYLSIYRTHQVAVTAPTNKAVRVGQNFAEYYHSNLVYQTIHSILGLKEGKDDWGRQVFVQDRTRPASIETKRLLVVDEGSMLPDELFNYLPEYVAKFGLKIIFVGDPFQINPIGQEESMPMNEIVCREYGIQTAQLTQIVRQKDGNPIIELTTQVRNNIHRPVSIAIRKTEIKQNEAGDVYGLAFMDAGDSKNFKQLLKTLYCSENYKQSTDFVKVIAWENSVVDYMSQIIRKFIFGKDVSGKIVIGENLLANTPIKNELDKKILFTTNDEFVVREFEMGEENLQDTGILKYYLAKVECFDYKDPKVATIRIIHEDSEALLNKLLDDLKELALYYKKINQTFLSKNTWDQWWELRDYFADVKYCYAITAHKSQGSTYNTAIVLEGNMDNNPRVLERNRLKYTAFTRPSRLLIVVNS